MHLNDWQKSFWARKIQEADRAAYPDLIQMDRRIQEKALSQSNSLDATSIKPVLRSCA